MANGGIVVVTTIVGALAFREKLNRVQIFGVLLGLVALTVTGCGEILWSMLLTV